MANKKAMVIGMDALILPIVKKLVREGELPHFAWMLKEGASSEAMPCLPPWTPTNWATIATGTYTGTNGCYLWSDHQPTEPEDKVTRFTFDSRAVTAEFIWEAAERAGKKTLCASYPGAWPPRVKNGYVITPLDRGVVSKPLVPGSEYTNQPSRAGVVELKLKEVNGWPGISSTALHAELPIGLGTAPVGMGWGQVVNGRAVTGQVNQAVIPGTHEMAAAQRINLNLLVVNSKGRGYDRILITHDKETSAPLANIGVGEWSRWLYLEFPYGDTKKEGSTRFKLLSLDPDGHNLRLVRSEVYPTTDWSYPESLGKELLAQIGPFFEWPAIPMRLAFGGVSLASGEQAVDKALRDTNLEELRYQALWLPKAARYIQNKYGWDLYYQHWHLPDALAHSFLARVDPVSPFYEPNADHYWDAVKQGYILADEMLGAFLDLADKNTYVIVVSDHGCTPDYQGVADIYTFLMEKGFMYLKDGVIDWSRTKAFSHGLMQIEVNLKGREPYGIVPPADYEKVTDEIIDALYSWKHPETGKRPIALALKKRDAQLIGYWGPTTADIVSCYNGGYAIGLIGTQSLGPARPYAEHWCKLPTDNTGFSSNMATFIMKGPGIKPGYERDPDRLGFMRLVDVVPTVSHLMGFRPPAHSQGAVLWDMIE